MSAKTDYITKLAAKIADHAKDLETLENGGQVVGLFDQFGAPPIDIESTKAEMQRVLNLISAAI